MTPALRTRATARLVAVVLLLATTSCAKDPAGAIGAAPDPTPSTATTAVTSAQATQKPGLTPQGFIPKRVGQVAGFDCADSEIDHCGIKFTVDKIDVDPPCVEHGVPAAAGRKTVALSVSMTTGTLTEGGAIQAPGIFAWNLLKGISSDGFVHEAKYGTCTGNDGRFTDSIVPNAKYAGRVEVEVDQSASSIASTRQVSKNGDRGWVWEIGG